MNSAASQRPPADKSFFRNAPVLVAGGAGFLGSNLIEKLLIQGAHIRATIHEKPPAVRDDRIEYVRCDLTNMHDCQTVVKDIEYVFMAAASTSGASIIEKNPLLLVTPSLVMNAYMLEASYFAQVKKFIFLSSSVVYPPTGDRPVSEDEMFDSEPYDIYYGPAWMKRYTETLCRLYCEKIKNPMATVVVRLSNVYGPCDDFDPATSHVTAATIRKVIDRNDPILIWGTGNDVRDVVYIDDCVDAILAAAEKIGTYNPINIASGKGYSIREILQTALEVEGIVDANIVYDESKPSTIPIRLYDISKAERELGFKPTVSLREGISRTIEWYRAQQ